MAYRESRLGLLVRMDPRRAAGRILAALKRKDGNATHTAAMLGVDLRTLNRWLQKLADEGHDLSDEIVKLRRARADERLFRRREKANERARKRREEKQAG